MRAHMKHVLIPWKKEWGTFTLFSMKSQLWAGSGWQARWNVLWRILLVSISYKWSTEEPTWTEMPKFYRSLATVSLFFFSPVYSQAVFDHKITFSFPFEVQTEIGRRWHGKRYGLMPVWKRTRWTVPSSSGVKMTTSVCWRWLQDLE